jgi:hypothetical protein
LSDADPKQVVMAKLAFVIVFEHVVFILKAIIQYAIPDVPRGLSSIPFTLSH